MYIDTSNITVVQTYTRHLLARVVSRQRKVLHRTLANVSHCSAAEIEAMRLALRHKEDLAHLGPSRTQSHCSKGCLLVACGRVQVARRLGIEKALGTTT